MVVLDNSTRRQRLDLHFPVSIVWIVVIYDNFDIRIGLGIDGLDLFG